MKKLILFLAPLCLFMHAFSQSAGDFRTVASGNWTDNTIWQRFNGTAWKAAIAYPDYQNGQVNIQDGNIVALDADLTIDQLVVDAGGQLALIYGYECKINHAAAPDVLINGTLMITGGPVTGNGQLKINGLMEWDGGNIQVPLNNAGNISIGDDITLANATLTNEGTIEWIDGGIYFNNADIVNNNVFNCYSRYSMNNSPNGVFTNNKTGVFNMLSAATVTNRIAFKNKGTVNFNAGTFNNDDPGIFTNSKTMNFTGGTFENASAVNFNKGTKMLGSGFILFYANNVSNFYTAVKIPPGVTLQIDNGSFLEGTGSVQLAGKALLHEGVIDVPLTVLPGGYLSFSYNDVHLSSTMTNNGSIDWTYGNIFLDGGNIINNGNFNIFSVRYWRLRNNSSGSFTNNPSGIVTKRSFDATTIEVPFLNTGVIKGMGTFDFMSNLTNQGIFSPGTGNATGILSTGTDYTNRMLAIRLNGASPGSEFDRLVVNGNATLKDTLTVTSTASIPPGNYTILSCTGSISGKFKATQLPAGYQLIYKTNSVIINVPATLTVTGNVDKEDAAPANITGKALPVFPNPVTSRLHFNFPSKSKTIAVQIFDGSGKVLYTGSLEAGKRDIDVSRFASGVYILQLRDVDGTREAKFVKQ